MSISELPEKGLIGSRILKHWQARHKCDPYEEERIASLSKRKERLFQSVRIYSIVLVSGCFVFLVIMKWLSVTAFFNSVVAALMFASVLFGSSMSVMVFGFLKDHYSCRQLKAKHRIAEFNKYAGPALEILGGLPLSEEGVKTRLDELVGTILLYEGSKVPSLLARAEKARRNSGTLNSCLVMLGMEPSEAYPVRFKRVEIELGAVLCDGGDYQI